MAKKGLAGVPIIPLIVIIIGIVVVLYILKNKNLFKFGTATTGAAVGATIPGPNVYPVVGPALTSGIIPIRSSGTSFRDNQGFDCSKCARESTWFFVPGGSDWTVKMGSHGEGSDNGSLIGFSADGQRWRCEEPHMTYHDLSGEGSVQLEASQRVGIKGISWNVSGNTQHHAWSNPALFKTALIVFGDTPASFVISL